jgi:hypothetical protein
MVNVSETVVGICFSGVLDVGHMGVLKQEGRLGIAGGLSRRGLGWLARGNV